jgi:hypothetical protein
MIAEEELLSSRLRDDLRDNPLSTSDMSDKTKPELRLEIAHVLFIDIVGYSKLLIDDQTELLQKLKRVVRNTEQRFHPSADFGDSVRHSVADETPPLQKRNCR